MNSVSPRSTSSVSPYPAQHTSRRSCSPAVAGGGGGAIRSVASGRGRVGLWVDRVRSQWLARVDAVGPVIIQWSCGEGCWCGQSSRVFSTFLPVGMKVDRIRSDNTFNTSTSIYFLSDVEPRTRGRGRTAHCGPVHRGRRQRGARRRRRGRRSSLDPSRGELLVKFGRGRGRESGAGGGGQAAKRWLGCTRGCACRGHRCKMQQALQLTLEPL
jgi:hypothetical protein